MEMLSPYETQCTIIVNRGDSMDTTLVIITLVAIMYFFIMIGVLVVFFKKRKSLFKQTTDIKTQQTFQSGQESKIS